MILTTKEQAIPIKLMEYTPKFSYSYQLINLDSGNYSVADRGMIYDYYTCTFKTVVKLDEIDALIAYFEYARDNDFSVDIQVSKGEEIFGINVDYEGSLLKGSILKIDPILNRALNSYEITIDLAAFTPSLVFLKTTDTFPTLGYLQSKFEANTNWDYITHTTYSTDTSIVDNGADVGYFEGSYCVTNKQMSQLREFYRTQRGIPFEVRPNMIGINRPFGKVGIRWSVVLLDIKEEKINPVLYAVRLSLQEVK